MNKIDEKFKNDKMKLNAIKNDSLICKNCIHKLDDTKIPGNVSRCKVYGVKPNDVLCGGKHCYKFIEANN